jgi:acetyl esterase/lipase
MALMRIEDYPPQAPRSEASAEYHRIVVERCAGIDGIDVAYGDDVYQHVALFVPDRPTGRVLAYIHGGRWSYGFKEYAAFMAPPLNAAGIILASIGHRLVPAVDFDGGFADVNAGIGWLRENVAGHGGDAGNLFVAGHSSGGHYAAMYALKTGGVRGAAPISGVYDLSATGFPHDDRPPCLPAGSDGRAESPIYSIAGPPPPFFVTWGSDDYDFLIPQAKRFADVLERAGGDVTRLECAGKTHFSVSHDCAAAGGAWMTAVIDWMGRH